MHFSFQLFLVWELYLHPLLYNESTHNFDISDKYNDVIFTTFVEISCQFQLYNFVQPNCYLLAQFETN